MIKKKFHKKGQAGKTSPFFFLFLFLFILFPMVLSVYLYQKLCDMNLQVSALEQDMEEIKGQLSKQAGEKPVSFSGAGENQTDGQEILEGDTGTKGQPGEEGKKVYLTFDDGPGGNTGKILDILSEYDVKATFFVVGKTDEASINLYKRIVDEGHTLGMHSYSHDYNSIYGSLDSFKKDFKKIQSFLYQVTGIKPVFYRFPGGSSNTVSRLPMEVFIHYLNEEGISYFDWNAANGDAMGGGVLPKEDLTANTVNGVLKNDTSIVLMHDSVSYNTTVDALPGIIGQIKKKGMVLLPITAATRPVQHIASTAALEIE